MSCIACGSIDQREFSSQIVLHFSGIKKLNEPGVWLFPNLLVCMDCGYSHFTIQEPGWRPLQASLRSANSGPGNVS